MENDKAPFYDAEKLREIISNSECSQVYLAWRLDIDKSTFRNKLINHRGAFFTLRELSMLYRAFRKMEEECVEAKKEIKEMHEAVEKKHKELNSLRTQL